MIWIDTDYERNTDGRLTLRGLKDLKSIRLTSPDDAEVLFKEASSVQELSFLIPKVQAWDPEEPSLYSYEIITKEKTFKGKTGFRHLEIKGQEVFWNDKKVHLFGIAYRQHKDDLDRTKKDLELFKKAGVNFLRSIYGSFDESLLSMADQMGFFVENTADLWEIGKAKTPIQNMPHMESCFHEKAIDLLMTGSHISILLWSLGHDSVYGSNFEKMRKLIKATDKSRPVTFHLPMSIHEEEALPDIWPCTYVDVQKQDLDRPYDQMVVFHTPGTYESAGYLAAEVEKSLPVLHEIWAPVPACNRDEMIEDQEIHAYWGESIKAFVDKTMKTSGCLGGAVLAGCDEDGSLPELAAISSGVLTKDGKPKKEYEELKKAYAPVSLEIEKKGGELSITVQNRYCFREIKGWHLEADKKIIFLPNLCPGGSHRIKIVSEEKEHKVYVKDASGNTVTGWFMREPAGIEKRVSEVKKTPALCESEHTITVQDDLFTCVFSKKTCLLEGVYKEGEKILGEGPYLACLGLKRGGWRGSALDVYMENGICHVRIRGSYEDTADLEFTLLLRGDGEISIIAKVLHLYKNMPHQVKAGIGLACGGLYEKGITFRIPGKAEARVLSVDNEDERILSDGSIHNVIKAYLVRDKKRLLFLDSDGSLSVKIKQRSERISHTEFTYEGNWYRISDKAGDFTGTETMSKEKGASAVLAFNGTGIRLYGPLGYLGGKAMISVDDANKECISAFLSPEDIEGASRGYEKRYGTLLYEISGLPEGRHRLKVEVLEQKEERSQDFWFSLDYAEVFGALHAEETELRLLTDWNYKRLVRGCVKKEPVVLTNGETIRVSIKMGDR